MSRECVVVGKWYLGGVRRPRPAIGSNFAHELHVGGGVRDGVAFDGNKEVAVGIDAEEGAADDFTGNMEFDLAGASPVVVDFVGE